MSKKMSADYGALAIKPIGVTGAGVPYGRQERTGNRVEWRLIDVKSGHAAHAVNTDETLIGALYNRWMIGDPEGYGARRLHAAEQLREEYEKTGNRQKVCGDYSPVRSHSEPEATPEEMAASVRYHAAIDTLSQWQWRVVRKVVIDDEMVDGLDLQHLVSGLDCLVRHFGK